MEALGIEPRSAGYRVRSCADVETIPPPCYKITRMRNLERDLAQLGDKVLDDDYALELYSALCNTEWRYGDRPGENWGCSWRMAGGIVADLRNDQRRGDNEEYDGAYEHYLDWYCSGREGKVSDRIAADLRGLGWVEDRSWLEQV